MKQNPINHIALVLDESGSMQMHKTEVVKVADGLISHLAKRSQELDQETRVTVYTFNDTVRCVVFDMDVLRLPSIRDFYRPDRKTALVDATMLAVNDLRLTCTKYGDHAFLTYVLTDGQENCSHARGVMLSQLLGNLRDNETVAALVPNQQGKFEAKGFGFPGDNVAVWNADSASGVEEVGRKIQDATDAYMTSRATGVRSTKTLFGGATQVNSQAVQAMGLKPQNPATFLLHPIPKIPDKTEVRDYIVNSLGMPFRIGTVFYQLMKPEKIQAGKVLAIRERGTDNIYMGPEVRQMLGLPALEVRVKPDTNPKYDIFVQSNSTNRHLVAHTTLLVMK